MGVTKLHRDCMGTQNWCLAHHLPENQKTTTKIPTLYIVASIKKKKKKVMIVEYPDIRSA